MNERFLLNSSNTARPAVDLQADMNPSALVFSPPGFCGEGGRDKNSASSKTLVATPGQG